jgi:hypothetical protein
MAAKGNAEEYYAQSRESQAEPELCHFISPF